MKKITLTVLFCFAICLILKAQDSLQVYVAKYKFPEGSSVSEVDVVVENNVLQINSSIGSAPLVKTAADTFSMPSYNDGIVIFTRNEAKKVTGIKIDVMNVSLVGTRVDSAGYTNGARWLQMPPKIPLPKMITD